MKKSPFKNEICEEEASAPRQFEPFLSFLLEERFETELRRLNDFFFGAAVFK